MVLCQVRYFNQINVENCVYVSGSFKNRLTIAQGDSDCAGERSPEQRQPKLLVSEKDIKLGRLKRQPEYHYFFCHKNQMKLNCRLGAREDVKSLYRRERQNWMNMRYIAILPSTREPLHSILVLLSHEA